MVDVAKLLEPVSQYRRRRSGPLILELDLTGGLAEEAPVTPLGEVVARRRQQLLDVVEGIRRGAQDPRVKALVARIDGQALGVAKVQEVRAAVAAFRAAGKEAVAWSESFGELGPGTVSYYLATAFDHIALVPTGSVGLTGVSLGQTFYGGAAERLGVRFEGGARHEYKTAPNRFTERSFTEPHREVVERIVHSLTDQVVGGIAEGRGLTADRVRELIERGPFLAAEALEAGLVDRLAYRDEVYGDLRRRHGAGSGGSGGSGGSAASERGGADPGSSPGGDGSGDDGGARLLYVGRYRHRAAVAERVPAARPAPYIALITATGMITSGRSRRSPLSGATMGADTVAAALRAARRDPHVRAVVFRVDSPGGSAVASDLIRREVRLTSEAGTPVVASMGDVAGSGGYYVTLGADAVVARPGTITGSIGVYSGKPVLTGLLERLGIAVERVDGGPHAAMFGTDRGFSESEWERVNALLDDVYADFTGKVAAARGLTPEQVDRVARGRVWTGRDAFEHGLVDDLGGLPAAVRIAREKAGLPGGRLRAFPTGGAWDRLVPADSSEDRAAAPRSGLVPAHGLLGELAVLAGWPQGAPLVMPERWEVR
ncbi:signal peptide peptidase SppA [Streptomonospora nanhaiensis]|uniref:signal peptide peptidase SppA n=1 Tax=Streptomonospora nanhaiensis TaxID=1323731 RepID=UPI001C996FC3|nr:signal peptide peptidase SppA [Streptomonospora nanhaiensis]MBX9389007.1 signal peptide peptidase SppA [Streptomonospora nanhaiensis]